MIRTISSISSLLLGIGLLLMGLALFSTSLGVRAVAEGYNDLITGLIMACYFGGFIVGSYLCPRMIRRIGPVRTYAALAAIGSVAAFIPSVVINPEIWALLRFILGISLVGLYMVLESWLNSIAPNEKRGQVFSVYMIITLLAHALGQFLLLIDPHAQIIAFGISAAFFSLGLIPVVLTRLPEPQAVPIPSLHLKHIIELSPLSVAGAFTGALATSSFWGMGAVFANRIGMSGVNIVYFMSITIFGGVLLQWPIGRFSDYIDRRKVLSVVTGLGIITALTASAVHTLNHTWLFAVMFCLGALLFPIYSLSVAYLNDRIQPDDALDASRSILLVYGFGALFGPIIAGVVMFLIGPVGLYYYIATVLSVFVLFALLRIKRDEPVPVNERSEFIPITRTSQAVFELDPRLDSPELSEPTSTFHTNDKQVIK